MAIVVKHSGNAAPAAVAAFGGGQGVRQEQDAGKLIAIDQAEKDRIFRANQAANAARERRMANKNAIEAQTRRDELSYTRDQEGKLQDQEMRREDWDYEYTEKQRREFDKLENAYQVAKDSGEYAPDELEELKKEKIRLQGGFEPQPRLKKKSKHPEGKDIGQEWTSEDGRFFMTRDKDGIPKKLAETNAQPTVQDITKLFDTVTKDLTRMETVKKIVDGKEVETEVEVKPTPEEVKKRMRELIDLHREFSTQVGQEPEPVAGREAQAPAAASVDDEATQAARDLRIADIAKKTGLSEKAVRAKRDAIDASKEADMAPSAKTEVAAVETKPAESEVLSVPDLLKLKKGHDLRKQSFVLARHTKKSVFVINALIERARTDPGAERELSDLVEVASVAEKEQSDPAGVTSAETKPTEGNVLSVPDLLKLNKPDLQKQVAEIAKNSHRSVYEIFALINRAKAELEAQQ